ncbi:MAG: hypothetical protein IJT34_05510 [Butyrivibrio sp.]|nr:hypothetical protein [Butyrivibrio sp.]
MRTGSDRRGWIYVLLFIGLAGLGFFSRFLLLGLVPAGLNQDEASIGYDAWCLATYGMDRNGYHWPVYPITWGSGGGSPLLVYLTALSTRIFGRNIWSLRFWPACLGALTIPLWLLLPVHQAHEEETTPGSLLPVFVTGLLMVVNPWHLMLSRWALDANILPFVELLAVILFVRGAQSARYRFPLYLCSAGVFALSIYAYGSATLVIPVALVCLAAYTMRTGQMHVRELISAIAVFVVLLAPLILFFAINALALPPVQTAWFSIPVFTASRSIFPSPGELPGQVLHNLRYLARFLTVGAEEGELICNVLPGYAQFYHFTWPLTLCGIGLALRRILHNRLHATADVCFLVLTAVTLLFSLFIECDVNRLTLLLVPMLYFQGTALWQLLTAPAQARQKGGRRVAGGLLCLAGVLFCGMVCYSARHFVRDYFGETYAGSSKDCFMPGYAEAVEQALLCAGKDQPIVSTYARLQAPFVLALYASETLPAEFLDTVVWRDATAEFRVATSFGRFTFGLPENWPDVQMADTIWILHVTELPEAMEGDVVGRFDDYVVLHVK